MIDTIIIGGGPAGLTAALYTLRSGISVTLIEQGAPGGQLLKTERIDNYPGFIEGITGMNLATNMFGQVAAFSNFNYVTGQVLEVAKDKDLITVKTDSGLLEAKTLIIASGGTPRLLQIPGEDTFSGRGVSYCAICDGFFFKGKDVAVIGGGYTAVEDALYLSGIANKVHLVHRRETFRANPLLVAKLKEKENIYFHLNETPLEILGTTKVEKLVLKKETLNLNGIFVAIGQDTNVSFLGDLIDLSDNKGILVNLKGETNVSGIYACGDVTEKILKQVSTAVGDGAVCGQEVCRFLENLS